MSSLQDYLNGNDDALSTWMETADPLSEIREEMMSPRLLSAIRALVECDPLTGTLNRRGIVSAWDPQQWPWLALFDLDGFKHYNDQEGHQRGDEILCETAKALTEQSTGPVCRWGGDEFIILSKEPLELVDMPLAFSIGWAQYDVDGTTLQSLFRTADERLYRQKRGR